MSSKTETNQTFQPLTFQCGNPWKENKTGKGLYLLTPDELRDLPTDGSVEVESILGDTRVWKGMERGDDDVRSFSLPNGFRLDVTAWGLRLPKP